MILIQFWHLKSNCFPYYPIVSYQQIDEEAFDFEIAHNDEKLCRLTPQMKYKNKQIRLFSPP